MDKKQKYSCSLKCEPVIFCTPPQASTLLSEGRGRTLILLMRHGATDWNMEVRLQGRRNIPLNSTGIQQAQIASDVIAAALKENGGCIGVYTSPLSRAVDTAAPISQKINGSEPVILEGLIERDYGSLEGMTYAERKFKYSGGAKYPDDMEAPEDATLRIMRAVGEVHRRSKGSTAVVITHGGVLNLLFARITRSRAGAGGNITANCTVSLVAAGDSDIIPLAYNLSGEAFTEYIGSIRKNIR